MSAAEHRDPYVQAANGCTVAGVVPLAALSGRPRRGPAPNWLFEGYDPPYPSRGKGFPAQLHITPNSPSRLVRKLPDGASPLGCGAFAPHDVQELPEPDIQGLLQRVRSLRWLEASYTRISYSTPNEARGS